MHELSIALGIVDAAAEEARRRSARIIAIHIRMGPLSGILPAALRSAFDLAREMTDDAALSTARLEIVETPVVMRCPACRDDRTIPSIQRMECPDCGAPATDLRAGRELEVTALEILE